MIFGNTYSCIWQRRWHIRCISIWRVQWWIMLWMCSRLIRRIKVGCRRYHCDLTAGSARNRSRSRHCHCGWLRGGIWHIRTRYYSQQRGGWFIGIWMIIRWRGIRDTVRRMINCIRFLHIRRTMLVRRSYLIRRFWDIIRCSMGEDRMLWCRRSNIRICYAQW